MFHILKLWTQMLWPPLSKCCGSAPVSSWCSLFTSVQGQHRGGTRMSHLSLPPPSSCTIYFNWHSRNVLLGLFRLKVIFLCDLFHDKEIDSLYQQKRRGKRVKGELALAFYFMVFVPQHNNPQEVTIPWRCLLIFEIKKAKE